MKRQIIIAFAETGGISLQAEGVAPFEMLAAADILRMEAELGWMTQRQQAATKGIVPVHGPLDTIMRKGRD